MLTLKDRTKDKTATKTADAAALQALPGFRAYNDSQVRVAELVTELRQAENQLEELQRPGRQDSGIEANAKRLLNGESPLDLPDVRSDIERQRAKIATLKRAIQLATQAVEPLRRTWAAECAATIEPSYKELARSYCRKLVEAAVIAHEMVMLNAVLSNSCDCELPDVGRHHFGNLADHKFGSTLHYIVKGAIEIGYIDANEAWLRPMVG